MSRRRFLAGAGSFALGTLAFTSADHLTPVKAQARGAPNIVLILLDDLGYGDLGCYGSEMIATPNIDRLASEGLRLTNAYSGAPICTPSRAALLTGRYGVRVGLPKVFSPQSPHGLPDTEKTVAGYLKEAGYSTGIFGKWHLGSRPEYNPTRYGFDRFFGPLHSNDQEPFEIWEGERVVETEVEQSLLTRRYTEKAAEFVRDNAERPFFAYVSHTMPHIPLHAEERFRGVSKAGTYGDVVESVDHYIGELVGVLEDEEVLANTLLIVTSDNGPWFSGSTGGLRGRKGETYEGGMRVPFVAHWPAMIRGDSIGDAPACFADVLPTLCSIAGMTPAADVKLDGQDISSLLMEPSGAKTPETSEHVPIYFFLKDNLNAVRRDEWKLHVRRVSEGGYGETEQMPQLFNLERDPEEAYDLAARNPEIVDELRTLIERTEADIQSQVGPPHDTPGINLDDLGDGLLRLWPL